MEELLIRTTKNGETVAWSTQPKYAGWYVVDKKLGFVLYPARTVKAKDYYAELGNKHTITGADDTSNGRVEITVPDTRAAKQYLFMLADQVPDTDEERRSCDSRTLWAEARAAGLVPLPPAPEEGWEGCADGTGVEGGEKYHRELLKSIIKTWKSAKKEKQMARVQKRDKKGRIIKKNGKQTWVEVEEEVHRPTAECCKEEVMASCGFYYCTSTRYNAAIRKMKKELDYEYASAIPTLYMFRRTAGREGQKAPTRASKYDAEFRTSLKDLLDKL